jgi:hypothetical protein
MIVRFDGGIQERMATLQGCNRTGKHMVFENPLRTL